MRLSDRLETILSCCGTGECLADVGTDHAQVPVELIERGCFRQAIAMDLREGPLQRAEETVRRRNLEDRIRIRQADGLAGLSPGEADVIVIAGMGGPLMRRILQDGKAVAEAAGRLVLSPQSELPEFRKFLHTLGCRIEEERLLEDEGKRYSVMIVSPGQEDPWMQEEYFFGKQPIERRDPQLQAWLKADLEAVESLLEKLKDLEGERILERRKALAEDRQLINKALHRMQPVPPGNS